MRLFSKTAAVLGAALLTSVFTPVQAQIQAHIPQKPTFVLVHGAFFDASGFEATAAALTRKGFPVVQVNLPGRPGQPGQASAQTLDGYRDVVLARMNQMSGPVILVGHSFGGIVVSQVAEAAPERVTEIIYLAALLPRDGEALTDLLPLDKANAMGPNSFQPEPAEGVARIALEDRIRLFCADCSPSTKRIFAATVLPEPLPPLAQKAHLTGRFAAIPKAYIYTRNDAIVSYPFQQMMVRRTPVRETITLDTGHLPMLSAPNKLAEALIAAID
jgi:pimeloyl-ACP methyl ester carboxylesterase